MQILEMPDAIVLEVLYTYNICKEEDSGLLFYNVFVMKQLEGAWV